MLLYYLHTHFSAWQTASLRKRNTFSVAEKVVLGCDGCDACAALTAVVGGAGAALRRCSVFDELFLMHTCMGGCPYARTALPGIKHVQQRGECTIQFFYNAVCGLPSPLACACSCPTMLSFNATDVLARIHRAAPATSTPLLVFAHHTDGVLSTNTSQHPSMLWPAELLTVHPASGV